jgi:4-aminobutyrate aminotransferase-like enzyme
MTKDASSQEEGPVPDGHQVPGRGKTPVGGGTDREPLGNLLPGLVVPPPGPATRALARRLRNVESRNVTWLGVDFPVFWTEARGANVRDADGNVYLDLTGAFAVALAGHAHPWITEAILRQAGILTHAMGDVHPAEVKVRLLERLGALSPWEEPRTVLANAGSEAVEVALKTALLATGRPGIVAFRRGYHGLTLGALATTAREDFRRPFRNRLYPGVRFAPFPTRDEALAPALQILEEALESGEDGHPVGAVILEPVQGRGGVRVPAPGFLEGVALRARQAGALLIFDEVFTGLGRTGTTFAFEHEGVVPDLLCLGKALGGGLPLSACVGPASVMDAWPESPGEALHTSTFLGHPLACAAALAFLEVLEKEDLPGRAGRAGKRFLGYLEEGVGELPLVREIRGRGLLLGIELDQAGAGARAAAAALREGLLVLPAGEQGEVVELTPSALIGDELLRWAAGALARALRRNPGA